MSYSPENDTETEDLTSTKDKISDYLSGLNANEEVNVYVWQYSENSYICYPKSTTDAEQTDAYFDCIFTEGVTIGEMKAMLENAGISPDRVKLCPVVNPLSSYCYVIDNEYREKLENTFWQ